MKAALGSVLDTLCDRFGFHFATVSLVDDDQGQIRTVAGRNAPWVSEAFHALDSSDIQAKVVSDHSTRLVRGWDTDLDPTIYAKYGHQDFTRIFVPIFASHGPIGTIEAGYRTADHPSIHPSLQSALERWVCSEVARTLESAVLLDRQRRYAVGLATLHELSYSLQTDLKLGSATEWLQSIAQAGLKVLGADLVLLHIWDAAATCFSTPIHAGELRGNGRLVAPLSDGNVISHTKITSEPLYVRDASGDASLVRPGQSTFAARQGIVSFAGVPLVVRGEVLGVLCANYRQRHQFGDRERRVIELYAQQVAALIASDSFARKRMEFDLHDLVKTKISTIQLNTSAALQKIDRGCQSSARDNLLDTQNICQEILSNVNTILDHLAITNPRADILHSILERALERIKNASGPPEIDVVLSQQLPDVSLVSAADLVYLIDQAVANARQHAHAQTVRVIVCAENDVLEVVVEDDGQGLELSGVGSYRNGALSLTPDELTARGFRGLASMAHRAVRLGGSLTVGRGHDGRGARISVTMPISGTEYGE
jgi:signal transduction histidine kinase